MIHALLQFKNNGGAQMAEIEDLQDQVDKLHQACANQAAQDDQHLAAATAIAKATARQQRDELQACIQQASKQ